MINETLEEYNYRHMKVIRLCGDKWLNLHLKHALQEENYELAEMIKKEMKRRVTPCAWCGEMGCEDCSRAEWYWAWVILGVFGLLLTAGIFILIYFKK